MPGRSSRMPLGPSRFKGFLWTERIPRNIQNSPGGFLQNLNSPDSQGFQTKPQESSGYLRIPLVCPGSSGFLGIPTGPIRDLRPPMAASGFQVIPEGPLAFSRSLKGFQRGSSSSLGTQRILQDSSRFLGSPLRIPLVSLRILRKPIRAINSSARESRAQKSRALGSRAPGPGALESKAWEF